ncbi:putative phosphatidate phosphatase [Brevipalpus obovatus]|uniref:putative phosphatidate phosphatase n=1 Tax=Brevipalpus obovatus TaxID=246614 RepID=UPI003D9F580E
MNGNKIIAVFLKIAVLLIIFWSGLHLIFVEPFDRGFFCDDESIKLPFKPHETLKFFDALYIILLLPILLVILSELFYYFVSFQRLPFEEYIWWTTTVKVLSTWFLATSIQLVIETSTKMMAGRLRPIFIDVCRPNVSCDNPRNFGRYVTNFYCTNEEPQHDLIDLRRSFPSGHASETMLSMAFLIIYLHKRYNSKESIRYLIICAQLILFLLAIFVGVSRVQDHKHHWSDVIGGFIIGIVVAFIVAKVTRGLDDLPEYDREAKKTLINEENSNRDIDSICIN